MPYPNKHRARAGRSSRAGFTIIELMIVSTILAMLMGVVVTTGNSMKSAYSTADAVAAGEARARRAMDQIVEILSTVDRASVTPTISTPLSSSYVEFTPSTGFAGGSPTWGNTGRIELKPSPADPVDGVDNDGNGIIDDNRLVWVRDFGLATEQDLVLCTQVPVLLQGETADGTDQNGNGLVDEPGFCVEVVGNRLIVRLTVEIVGPKAMKISRTLTRTIALRMGN